MKTKKKNKYELGSYVKAGGVAGNMIGQAIGGESGNVLSGVSSGVMAGAALGPVGMIAGGALGLGASLLGNNKVRKAEEAAYRAKMKSNEIAYQENIDGNLDINNENPYGIQQFENGGEVDPKKQKLIDNKTSKYKSFDTSKLKKPIGGHVFEGMEMAITEGAKYLNKKFTGKDKISENFNIKNEYINNIIDNPGEFLASPGPMWTKQGINLAKGAKGAYNNMLMNPTLKNIDRGFNVADVLNPWKYEDGGMIPENNQINIEKGELQIDPQSGKILREYKGINPETGGLYKEHSKKGKDSENNMVTAEEGSFIITKKEAKNYKDALDNNDKIRKNTILQNIRNYKERVSPQNKFALGSDVPSLLAKPQSAYNQFNSMMNMWSNGLTPGYLAPSQSNISLNPGSQLNTNLNLTTPTSVAGTNTGSNLNGLDKTADLLTQYGPSLINMGRGMFGKTEVQPYATPNQNPYKSKILSNMPRDISFEPVRNEMYRQRNSAFNQIDNSTAGSPIARANKQNVVANTQINMGKALMDNEIANNGVRGQRQNVYSNLGNQEMNEANRVQQLNLGIDDINARNRGAKNNLLTTGLSQLQQTYLNNKTNTAKANMDKYKIDLLKQMFPNLKYYGNQFDFNKITGGI